MQEATDSATDSSPSRPSTSRARWRTRARGLESSRATSGITVRSSMLTSATAAASTTAFSGSWSMRSIPRVARGLRISPSALVA